jgi:hypothetical protein
MHISALKVVSLEWALLFDLGTFTLAQEDEQKTAWLAIPTLLLRVHNY